MVRACTRRLDPLALHPYPAKVENFSIPAARSQGNRIAVKYDRCGRGRRPPPARPGKQRIVEPTASGNAPCTGPSPRIQLAAPLKGYLVNRGAARTRCPRRKIDLLRAPYGRRGRSSAPIQRRPDLARFPTTSVLDPGWPSENPRGFQARPVTSNSPATAGAYKREPPGPRSGARPRGALTHLRRRRRTGGTIHRHRAATCGESAMDDVVVGPAADPPGSARLPRAGEVKPVNPDRGRGRLLAGRSTTRRRRDAYGERSLPTRDTLPDDARGLRAARGLLVGPAPCGMAVHSRAR